MEKKKIIICDDEPDIRALVKTAIESVNGYSVIEAENGDDCLKKLKKDPNILMVLLDIRMPGITPQELIEEINKDKTLKKVKISYLTVVEFSEEIKEKLLKQKQVVDYITKPFKIKNLIDRIKHAIG